MPSIATARGALRLAWLGADLVELGLERAVRAQHRLVRQRCGHVGHREEVAQVRDKSAASGCQHQRVKDPWNLTQNR